MVNKNQVVTEFMHNVKEEKKNSIKFMHKMKTIWNNTVVAGERPKVKDFINILLTLHHLTEFHNMPTFSF